MRFHPLLLAAILSAGSVSAAAGQPPEMAPRPIATVPDYQAASFVQAAVRTIIEIDHARFDAMVDKVQAISTPAFAQTFQRMTGPRSELRSHVLAMQSRVTLVRLGEIWEHRAPNSRKYAIPVRTKVQGAGEPEIREAMVYLTVVNSTKGLKVSGFSK